MTYEKAVIFCMADLVVTSFSEIEEMTLTELYFRIEAQKLKELKKEHDIFKLAFAMRNVKATKNVGTKKKPREEWQFKQIKDIFDYEEYRRKLENFEPINKEEPETEPQQLDIVALAELNARLNAKAKENENK